MITKILGFLKNTQMSAGEWLMVTVATVILGLVTALKVTMLQLHKAQVALLEQNLDSKQARAAQDTEDARQVYRQAVDALIKAGGKLAILLALALSSPARSISPKSEQPPVSPLLPKCESALSACDNLVKAQDSQIKALQDAVKAWKAQATKSSAGDAPVLITGTAAGLLSGVVVGEALNPTRGIAVGGVVGGVVGLGIGLIINGVK